MAPFPPDPPPPEWDAVSGVCSQWNTAQSLAQKYGYDATNQAIKDVNGVDNFLVIGVSTITTGQIAWFVSTRANSQNCPLFLIPQATFNMIKNGTLNTGTGQITYSGQTYTLFAYVNSSGQQIAYAQ